MIRKFILFILMSLAMVSVMAQYDARTEGNQPFQQDEWKSVPNPETDAAMFINEGFDDITTLFGNGWVLVNMSNPLGLTNWFQGNSSVFSAYDGAPSAYIGANYNNASGAGTISNWLITPEYLVQNGDQISFYSRTANGSLWPDRLQLRLSINGPSTNVGANESSVGDFSILLIDINPALVVGGYPEVWTKYTATVTGLTGIESGRFALRYYVTSGGPSGTNSNYIGIDRVEFAETASVPVSNWAVAIGIGLILIFAVFKFRRLV